MYDAGKIDTLTKVLFSFGKFLSALMVLASLIAFVIGIFQYIGAAPDKLQPPEFDSFTPYLGLPGERPVDQDFSRIDTKRAIENKYDEHMKNIVKDFQFETGYYNQLVEWLSTVPENRRTRFIDGFYSFMNGFQTWVKENKTKLKLTNEQVRGLYLDMGRRYQTIFTELLRKEEARWDASYQERTNLLLFIVSTVIFMVLFLIVPIALKIEENTRFFK